jgi:hypothetical protein
MAQRKPKGWRRVHPGELDGRRVTIADSDRIDAHDELVAEFMFTVFDLEPREYVLTDEARLLDFADFDSSDTSDIWVRIGSAFGLAAVDARSELLVDILDAIAARRNLQ